MKTIWYKSLFYCGLTFFSLLILASTALTATIAVPDDYSTIQAAINAANYGDTVSVRAGTYSPSTNGEMFPINMRNGVNLIGEGADSCVLDAEMTNCVILCDGITDTATIIEGFSITNGGIFYDGEPGVGGGIVCCYGSSPTIAHNTLTGNSAEWGGGITCEIGSSPTITNNTITGNHPPKGGGIWCKDSTSNPTITNNIIYENSGTYFGGIICWLGSSPTITNNTVSGNIAVFGGGILASEPGTTITNNIITGNIALEMGGGLGAELGSSATITYNDVWDNAPIDYYDCVPGVGCISVNPSFVDPVGGDYHLQSSSPCIDIGDNSALGLPAIDFDGSARIHDGDENGTYIVDMGADEYCATIDVQIDIKPGSDLNPINLGSKGSVPVAIFSTIDFDATTIDPLTVTLAGASVRIKGKGTPQASAADVDGDGLIDLIVHVDTSTLQLRGTATEAILEGETFDGQKIRGVDTVRIVN